MLTENNSRSGGLSTVVGRAHPSEIGGTGVRLVHHRQSTAKVGSKGLHRSASGRSVLNLEQHLPR
jgi:hypothetical protein